MNKRTKLILSVIGVSAVVLPVVLLVLLTSGGEQAPEIPGDRRQLDTRNVEEAAKRTVPVTVTPVSTPEPATPSASPEATGSESTPSP